jgi:hypothetical protein
MALMGGNIGAPAGLVEAVIGRGNPKYQAPKSREIRSPKEIRNPKLTSPEPNAADYIKFADVVSEVRI